MVNLNELTIKDLHEKLKKKEVSALEITDACLQEIKKTNEEINSFISVDQEGVLKQAEQIDKLISKGKELGVLEGIPMAVKDNILVDGQRTTAGSKILENYKAPYNATVVSRLKDKGALILGKTNLDEFAMGSSTENSAFGVVKNPHDKTRVSGGSSGGSTASVALNQCIYALGSDTGGSIRQPASFCGVVGLKPTYGRVSRHGLIAMASSLDQIGPIAKSVEDARTVLSAISGKDPLDSTSVNKPSEFEIARTNLKGVKIGMPKEYFIEGIDKGVEEEVRNAVKEIEKLGARIEEISLPNSMYALAVYYIIMPAEASANLARYDGVKYGMSEQSDDLLGGYLKTREKGFGDEVRRRVMLGTYVLSAGYYDAYYLKAQKVRTLIKKDFQKAFERVDAVVTPVSPVVAFKIGERTKDPLSMYLADIYTVSVNLAGLPAISVPCGKSGGLPVGLQIIGDQFKENVILDIAELYEKAKKTK